VDQFERPSQTNVFNVNLVSVDPVTGDTLNINISPLIEDLPFHPGSPAYLANPNGFSCSGIDVPATVKQKPGRTSYCSIRKAWIWGETDGRQYYPDAKLPGLAATEELMSELTGLPIHDYLVVPENSFSRMIDSLGGVDLQLQRPLRYGRSPDEPETAFDLKAGKHHLSGPDALWLARSSAVGVDDERDQTFRRQCLLAALQRSDGTVRIGSGLVSLLTNQSALVNTSIKTGELEAWIGLWAKARGGRALSLAVRLEQVTKSRQANWTIDPRTIRTAVARASGGSVAGQSPTGSTAQPHGVGPFATPTVEDLTDGC
jgi:hypothetical protein